MQKPQEARPRARSPFTAAFLSLLFPGLGQLYAGAPMRALVFAAAPILVARADRRRRAAHRPLRAGRRAVRPFLLTAIFVFNLVALVYRLVAIVDAYRVAEYLNAHAASGDGRLGRRGCPATPCRSPGCWRSSSSWPAPTSSSPATTCSRRTPSGAASSSARVGEECAADRVRVRGADRAARSDASAADRPAADARSDADRHSGPGRSRSRRGTASERLNILLIGADEQARRPQHRHADHGLDRPGRPSRSRCSACRATRSDVPVPPGPAQRVWGRTYGEQDQLVLREQPAALRPVARQRPDARLQRPQVDPRRAVRPRDPLLRRGQLQRLQEGRRCGRRGDHQRPGARRPTTSSRARPAAPSGCTSRAGSSTWTATRRCATPGRATPRPTSTAARDSSGCSCRCASRPTHRR